MKLEKIVTLANQKVRLLFLAMERSLRATGCDLPIWVIPYDTNLFDLPENATWWELPNVRKLLADNRAHPMITKYQCFTTENYQFVDTDVIFLRNPQQVLADHHGFITSCGYWREPAETCTPTLPKPAIGLIAYKHFRPLILVPFASFLDINSIHPTLWPEIRLPHIQAASAKDANF
jgi:hypothetical protein